MAAGFDDRWNDQRSSRSKEKGQHGFINYRDPKANMNHVMSGHEPSNWKTDLQKYRNEKP